MSRSTTRRSTGVCAPPVGLRRAPTSNRGGSWYFGPTRRVPSSPMPPTERGTASRTSTGLSAPEGGANDPKSRVLRAMAEHMRVGGAAPALVLFCVQPQAGASELHQGGSVFPAVQNFLLAARAQGLGAAITLWHMSCAESLRALIGIPDDWVIAALVTAGWPKGRHRTVRRKPLSEVAVVDRWDRPWLSEKA